MEYSARHADTHSALMPAVRITLVHFSVSSAINLLNSAGEPGFTVVPRSARRAALGVDQAGSDLLVQGLMISADVFLGAPTQYHLLASKPGKNSSTVGVSGIASAAPRWSSPTHSAWRS